MLIRTVPDWQVKSSTLIGFAVRK